MPVCRLRCRGLMAVLSGPAGKGQSLPPVLDSMQVEAGYEQALGAALGEDLSAPVEGPAPRQWLDVGRVVTGLPDLPEEAEPFERLCAGAGRAASPSQARSGWCFSPERGQALLSGLKPGQRLVSPDGDLWRWDGFVQRAGAPSAAALRLQHRNRLQELEGELALEASDLAGAEQAVAERQDRAAEADTRLQRARGAVRDADAALTAAREASRRTGPQGPPLWPPAGRPCTASGRRQRRIFRPPGRTMMLSCWRWNLWMTPQSCGSGAGGRPGAVERAAAVAGRSAGDA